MIRVKFKQGEAIFDVARYGERRPWRAANKGLEKRLIDLYLEPGPLGYERDPELAHVRLAVERMGGGKILNPPKPVKPVKGRVY